MILLFWKGTYSKILLHGFISEQSFCEYKFTNSTICYCIATCKLEEKVGLEIWFAHIKWTIQVGLDETVEHIFLLYIKY